MPLRSSLGNRAFSGLIGSFLGPIGAFWDFVGKSTSKERVLPLLVALDGQARKNLNNTRKKGFSLDESPDNPVTPLIKGGATFRTVPGWAKLQFLSNFPGFSGRGVFPVSPHPLNLGGAISPPKFRGRHVQNTWFYSVFWGLPPKFWG